MKPYAEIKIATRELVEALLSMNTKNRHLKRSVIARYKRDIEAGNWMLTNQGIGVSESGVLIDGQHRLEAIKECGYPALSILIVYGLSMESQQVVDQQAKRSARDLLSFAFNARVSRGAPAIGNCILRNHRGWAGSYSPTITELMDCLTEYMDEIEEIVGKPKLGNFYAAPHLAAFVMIAKVGNREKVLDFMEMVETGEMLTKTMPAFHLRNLMVTTRKGGGGMQAQIERFKKTTKATECFIQGGEMGVLRI